ncbi:peptidase [Brachybacterium sp. SGAir0954]|uniref:Type 1 glutamine amidotransferase-like domain-containing protein n=1 Tax=Brachybacterium sp. SGAir0954 TaxID=2571029 RepID=UPI0010CD3414|nr:Type 1 glutamine amidotransferase-like domain-containing protein [Brachybacterium sp. SGAir0954]QCR53604.1 peptidase [Brachybacterium sp. SGAir0954]
MRLYLSSYQLGDHPEELVRMAGEGARGWVVANALDGGDPGRRSRDTARQIAALARIGLRARDLDLREHDPSTIARAVGEPDFVWLRGGNVFTLRGALARSGLDALLVAGIREDAFVHAGFSAGACVLAPSLAGLEHCDGVDEALRLHGEVRWDGLGVLDRPVVPHLDSPGHPETALLGEVAARYARGGQAFWALRDGEALVVDGDRTAVV